MAFADILNETRQNQYIIILRYILTTLKVSKSTKDNMLAYKCWIVLFKLKLQT